MYAKDISGENPLLVYTLSDASGQTAEMVVKAAVSQFQGSPVRIVRLPRVVTQQQLANMVKLASQHPCLLAYTFVRHDLREMLEAEAAKMEMPTIDLLGGLIGKLAEVLATQPAAEAGLVHAKDEDYFKRMDAIDFAIKYDDGKSPHGLLHADLVLVGVSRTSKTPTCMYLAQNQGLKTGNIPLVPGVQPPKELWELPPDKVIGLTVKSDLLHEIRSSRLVNLGLPPESAYADQQKILDELAFAEEVFRKLRCPVVDVTYKAVEETASEILAMTQRKELLA